MNTYKLDTLIYSLIYWFTLHFFFSFLLKLGSITSSSGCCGHNCNNQGKR